MPTNCPPVLGLVVPCKNEAAVLPVSAQIFKTKLGSMIDCGLIADGSRVFFVDDGSTDGTWEVISRLVESNACFAGIKLARNFGHQYAVYAGLMLAEGDALISIDADLQDDIDAVDEMVAAYLAGNEIVYGVRADRHSDNPFKRWTARMHYWMAGRLGVSTVPDHADFRLMSRRAVSILGEFKERNLYLRGLVPLLGLQSSRVYYKRSPRLVGESKYGLRDMVGLSIQGITSISIMPLRIISMAGLLVFVIATGFGFWALYAALTGNSTAIAGWASTVIPIYLLGGLQLLAIGVAGEYIGKTYLEVKSRPTFIVEETVHHQGDTPDAG